MIGKSNSLGIVISDSLTNCLSHFTFFHPPSPTIHLVAGKGQKRSCVFTSSQAKKVSAIGKTASSATAEEVNSKSVEFSTYTNWLAAQLYGSFHKYKDLVVTRDELQYTIHDLDYVVSYKSLDLIVKQFRGVTALRMESEHHAEGKMTAKLSVFLGDYLIPSKKKTEVLCMHQYPFYGHGEKADVHIAAINDRYDIVRSILIGDMKPHGMKESWVESMAYGSRVLKIAEEWDVQLLLSYTCNGLKLQIIQSLDAKMAVWNVCEAQVWADNLYNFFFTLYLAVNYLLDRKISQGTAGFFPLPDIYITSDNILSHQDVKFFRVFQYGGHVYKLFDTTLLNPNQDLMNAMSTFQDLSVHDMDATGRFQYMKYKFLNGCHQPKSIKQFAIIASLLTKIHNDGYVHSDIRAGNLIFGQDVDSAWIIDYDLAEKEGVPYPDTYIFEGIDERHPNAQKNQPRSKDHDIHSLLYTINNLTEHNLTEEYTLDNIIEYCSTN